MMDYVKYIREMVGHKPIILAGSSVLIINSENQVLLQLRKDNNLWTSWRGHEFGRII